MEKKPTPASTMGLLVGLVMIIFNLVTYFTNLYTETWLQMVGGALLLAGIITAVLLHAKEVGYRDSLGGLFGFGFKATAAVTVITIAYVILQGLIFPDIKTRFLEAQRQLAYARPEAQANREAIEQGLGMLERNYTLFIILSVIFWTLVIGAVASLIGAAIPKKNRPDTSFENI